MASPLFVVQTNLSPDELTDVAIATYVKWLAWAIGDGSLLGKTLKHPSGRYASSISWRRTGIATVAIIADESIAPEATWLEKGASAHSMRDAMLGEGNTKTDKQGYRYRVIPIRKDGAFPSITGNTPSVEQTYNGGGLTAKLGKIWSRPVPHTDASHYAVMSDRPGASAWNVPAQPAYAPAAILAALLRLEYGKK
jgi:hypothetical protein